jgi:hypothetical protein
MMGELQFFLGLQIKEAKEGTFVHQAKYTKDIIKKFKMDDSKPLSALLGVRLRRPKARTPLCVKEAKRGV